MARGKSRQNDGRNPIGRGKSKTLPIGAGNNVSNSLPIGATASNNGLTSTPIGSLLIRATTCIGPTSIPASVGEIGSTSHTTVAGSAPVSLPTGASNNGSTSIPMGVGDNGSASQAANVSNNEPASQAANVSNNGPASQAANVSNNGPASQAANVSNNGPASLPLANEPETEESVEPNSHGSVGNENVNANCINQPSMYDAVNVNRTVNGRKAIQVIANEIWPSCARTMREIFKLKVDPNGCTWKYISAETKDLYFEEYRV